MNFPNAPGPADSSGRARLPSKLSPMLATPGVPPRGDAGWAYEMKWDGVRALAFIEDRQLRLASRTGRDITVAYPELTGLGPAAGVQLLLDGEVVAFDDGRPSFAQLQQRMHVTSAVQAARLSGQVPGVLPDLRCPVRGRAPAAGPAVCPQAGAPGGAGSFERRQLADPALLHGVRGRRRAGGIPRAGPGRHRGQTAGLPVPARAAVRGVAEDQEHPPPGGRRRRVETRRGGKDWPARLPAGRRAEPPPAWSTPGMSAPASPGRRSSCSATGWPPGSSPPARSRVRGCRARTPGERSGSGRTWSSTWPSRCGHRRAGSAPPPIKGCATTRIPPRSSAQPQGPLRSALPPRC